MLQILRNWAGPQFWKFSREKKEKEPTAKAAKAKKVGSLVHIVDMLCYDMLYYESVKAFFENHQHYPIQGVPSHIIPGTLSISPPHPTHTQNNHSTQFIYPPPTIPRQWVNLNLMRPYICIMISNSIFYY